METDVRNVTPVKTGKASRALWAGPGVDLVLQSEWILVPKGEQMAGALAGKGVLASFRSAVWVMSPGDDPLGWLLRTVAVFSVPPSGGCTDGAPEVHECQTARVCGHMLLWVQP